MQAETLGARSAAAAHEFNNVASVVRLLADAVLEDASVTGRSRQAVEAIRDAADRGAATAWALLDLVHHRPPVLRHVDLAALAREVALEAAGDGVEVDVTVDGDRPVHVDADPDQLHELLSALLVNAGEAGARTVSIRVGPSAAVTVVDDGEGMASDMLRRATDPFVTTRAGDGRGLGLAYASRIAADHGGHLALTSSAGEGTSATLTLPALPDRTGDDPGLVLVVDDDPDVRTALTDVLETLGLRSLAAPDAATALDLHAAHGDAIGLVISDVTMHGVDGLALHRALLERDPALRVVLTSGRPRPPDVADRVTWLRKPFSREQLAAVAAVSAVDG